MVPGTHQHIDDCAGIVPLQGLKNRRRHERVSDEVLAKKKKLALIKIEIDGKSVAAAGDEAEKNQRETSKTQLDLFQPKHLNLCPRNTALIGKLQRIELLVESADFFQQLFMGPALDNRTQIQNKNAVTMMYG